MKQIDVLLRVIVPAFDAVMNIIHYPELLHKKRFIAEIFYRYIPATLFFVWLFSLVPNQLGDLLYVAIILFSTFRIYEISAKKKRYFNTLYFLIVLNIGFLGIRSFLGHTIFADSVAESIGWETGSPFQIELAFYHLGLAVAAIVFIWNKSLDLALGLVISKSLFLLGAFGVHIHELIATSNTSTNNVGVWIIYADLILPILLIWLLAKTREESRTRAR